MDAAQWAPWKRGASGGRQPDAIAATVPQTVIPAQAGIQAFTLSEGTWIPACAGMTVFKFVVLATDARCGASLFHPTKS
ncbi:hypothetical protein F2P46_23885 [Massilia sp. CCM 8734]|nr:hypothetical protein [Massilia sp. CCM 8734]